MTSGSGQALGLDPDWCRIIVHLPVKTSAERNAAEAVMTRFRRRYDGCTYSHPWHPVFVGWWGKTIKSRRTGKKKTTWYDDRICLLTLDVNRSIADTKKIERDATNINTFAKDRYDYFGAPQQEIWIIVQQSSRLR